MSKEHEVIRVALDSLGCKLNQAEIELLAKQFTDAAYSYAEYIMGLQSLINTHIRRKFARMQDIRTPDLLKVK